MKRALSVMLQTILLLLSAMVFGIVLPGTRHSPFHLVRNLSSEAGHPRQYEFDWLIGVLLVYFVLLLIGLAARRIRTSWVGSTVALVITLLIVLLFTRIGYREGSPLVSAARTGVQASAFPRVIGQRRA